MGNDFTTLVSYTFSKAIDTGSAIRTHGGDTDFAQDNYDIKKTARGLANYDQKHRLVTSLLWEPPIGRGKARLNQGVMSHILGNWQIGTILSIRSGLPYTVTNGTDDANVGDSFVRCRKRRAGSVAVVFLSAEHRLRQRRHPAARHALRKRYRRQSRNRGNDNCQCDRNAKIKGALGQLRVPNNIDVRRGMTLRL